MKKILILVLVILLCSALAFSVGAVIAMVAWDSVNAEVSFSSEWTFSTAELGEDLLQNPSTNLVEITYNDLLLGNGNILRNLQFWVNTSAIQDKTQNSMAEVKAVAASKLREIEKLYKQMGYSVKYTEDHIEVGLEYYESYTEMYIAYGIDGYEKSSSDTQTEWGFFFNRYINTRKTGLFGAVTPGSYIDNCATILSEIDGLGREDITYIYNYGTKYSKGLITSDADKVYSLDELNVNIHQFVMSEDTLDRDITLTQRAPNATVWYALTLVVSIALAGVFIVVAIREKNKGDK